VPGVSKSCLHDGHAMASKAAARNAHFTPGGAVVFANICLAVGSSHHNNPDKLLLPLDVAPTTPVAV